MRRGSVYGVLGPNGAGKTTTIRMLATLLRPDAGSAKVLGHDVVHDADAVRALVSLTGQLRLRGRGADRPREPRASRPATRVAPRGREGKGGRAAGGLRAGRCGSRLVKAYSGGMRRRLDIAASIVVTPALMFLDEPTTGLDPRSRIQVWEIVRAMAAAGTTILLCTQYLDEADQLADGIAVIDHGRVIAEGTPGAAQGSVGSGSLHVRLLDPDNAPTPSGSSPVGSARSASSRRPRRCPAPVRTPSAPRTPSPSWRARASASPTSPWQPSLDEVFLALTGHPSRPRGSDRRRGGRSMTTTRRSVPVAELAVAGAVREPRPPRPSGLSAALTFGWRGMLKIKHVPEQLLDVTITPVLFVVMFTYLFGGAVAGSTAAYLQFILPGSW